MTKTRNLSILLFNDAEVLDFCGKHNIHPECKIIRPDEVNDAFDVMAKGDISHRYVMDMSSLAVEG